MRAAAVAGSILRSRSAHQTMSDIEGETTSYRGELR